MTDTIVAQATPEGISALAVIRVSGNLTKGLLLEACNLPHPTPRHAYYKRYLDLNGNSPDQIIVTYFESGKSFTSESSIEIICHGNPIIVNEIISDLLARGCRIADPGEFTFRAYQNGKIDLIQAEAIAELISAKSRRALELANKNLKVLRIRLYISLALFSTWSEIVISLLKSVLATHKRKISAPY